MSETAPKQTVFPNVKYLNPRAAIGFLADAFGFEEHFVVEGPDGDFEHAQLRVGANLIFLSRDRDDDQYGLHSPVMLKGASQALCVWVPDERLDEHQTRAAAAGAKILNPIHDSVAGVREYSCADREGQVWTFSGYLGEAR